MSRKAPAESATQFPVGIERTGLDRNLWVIQADRRGIHRWVKSTPHPGLTKTIVRGQTFLIHDNGGRPFKVVLRGKIVQVYRVPESKDIDEPAEQDYTKLVKTFEDVTKVYIGPDPSEPRFKGNSILLRFLDNKYVYIGSEIYQFSLTSPDEKFIKYVSPVGNNDVPYPYMVTNKNVYFMTENVFADRKIFGDLFEDPYQILYFQEPKIPRTKIKHRKVLVKRI